MNAIIKQIQAALEHGRPLEVKTSPLGEQVLKEIQQVDVEEKNRKEEVS